MLVQDTSVMAVRGDWGVPVRARLLRLYFAALQVRRGMLSSAATRLSTFYITRVYNRCQDVIKEFQDPAPLPLHRTRLSSLQGIVNRYSFDKIQSSTCTL